MPADPAGAAPLRLAGGCHCGNLRLTFETERDPAELAVRACSCSFCRRHGVRTVSDPAGRVEFVVRDPAQLSRYQFGLGTAQFLVCRTCGVYVGAVIAEHGSAYAVVNLNALETPEAFARTAVAVSYDAELAAERRARRRAVWTPATVVEVPLRASPAGGGRSMTELVLLEREGEIARVTLNQPAKLNAINHRMWSRLRELFTELDADQSLRCVILGGSGERAFSVGADISEFEQNRSTLEKARAYHEHTHAAMQAITGCRHPIVAQIKGLCVGGGLELATTCDLRICGAGARFGIPIKRLGLVVSYAELKPLVDLIGPANALEILLEGRIHDADRRAAHGSRQPRGRRCRGRAGGARHGAADRRRGATGRPLAQAVHATRAATGAAQPPGDGRELPLLRDRGLPHRLSGVPRQAQARVRGPLKAGRWSTSARSRSTTTTATSPQPSSRRSRPPARTRTA